VERCGCHDGAWQRGRGVGHNQKSKKGKTAQSSKGGDKTKKPRRGTETCVDIVALGGKLRQAWDHRRRNKNWERNKISTEPKGEDHGGSRKGSDRHASRPRKKNGQRREKAAAQNAGSVGSVTGGGAAGAVKQKPD